MKLADRSPAAVLLLAHVVVFGVVLVEIAMWSAPSPVFVGATLLLAAVVAVGVLRWFFSLLDEEDSAPVSAAVEAPAPAPAPVAVTAAPVAAVVVDEPARQAAAPRRAMALTH